MLQDTVCQTRQWLAGANRQSIQNFFMLYWDRDEQ